METGRYGTSSSDRGRRHRQGSDPGRDRGREEGGGRVRRDVEFVEFPWGCDFYRAHGQMMDEDGFDRLQEFDAIYLGAIGDPSVPDHISVWQLILPIRQRFDQYVNLRPMRLVAGVDDAAGGTRARRHRHGLRPRELRRGVRRHRRPAARRHAARESRSRSACSRGAASSASRATRFETAMKRPRKLLASATKSNALQLLDGAVGPGRRRGGEGLPVGVVAQVPRRRAGGADGHRSRRAST